MIKELLLVLGPLIGVAGIATAISAPLSPEEEQAVRSARLGTGLPREQEQAAPPSVRLTPAGAAGAARR